jgi:hypothetical protein
MLDSQMCLYRSSADVFFYVQGPLEENELVLQAVLTALFEAISILLR